MIGHFKQLMKVSLYYLMMFCCVLLLTPLVALSAELPPPALDELYETEPSQTNREIIYNSALDFANWVDGFFGESDELASADYDFFRLVNQVNWQDNGELDYKARVRAKVYLPKLEEKLSLIVNDRDNEELGSIDEPIESITSSDDNQFSAAVNYESEEYFRSKFDTRIGLDSSLESFFIFKHRLSMFKGETTSLTNFNDLFWKEEEGFGVNPRFELDKILDKDHLIRWQYSYLKAEKRLGNEWSNRFSFITKISEENWLSYDLSLLGRLAYDYDIYLYRLAFRYRKQLPVKWLFFEIEPEFLWLREPDFTERKFITGLILRLEIEFKD